MMHIRMHHSQLLSSIIKNVMIKIERQFIGFQYSATGVCGYSFREGVTDVFRTSCLVLPNPDIGLLGFDKKLWHRNYDGQITLFPGVRRNIVDESGNVHGYYEYAGLNKFYIITNKMRVRVDVFEDGWNVFGGTNLVATILRLTESERKWFVENGYDMEKRFLVSIFKEIDLSLYPYIMAIPILGF